MAEIVKKSQNDPTLFELPEKGYDEYTKDELLDMPKEKFDKIVGTDLTKMSREQLILATRRKSQDAINK
jgi:hypothetical protein